MLLRKLKICLIIFAAVTVLSLIIFIWSDPERSVEHYKNFVNWFAGQKYSAVAIFVCLYIAAPLVLTPIIVLTLTAGVLFGLVPGTVVASLSSLGSAAIAFGVGKKFRAQPFWDQYAAGNIVRTLNDAVSWNGWKIVLLLRFTPFFPFSVVNFLLGVSKISFFQFAFATWIGMLPGLFVYSYLGSLARNITELSLIGRKASSLEWALSILGAVSLLLLFGAAAYHARKALRKRLGNHWSVLP